MFIKNINIINFRGYDQLQVTFSKGLNIILGCNGAGKTNLVEAINYLSLGRSFRTNNEKELIKKNNDFAKLNGVFVRGASKKEINMILSSKGKKITLNGHDVLRITELINEMHVIVFKPHDVFLFDDAPATRRKFMDLEIAHQSSSYLYAMKKYEKILYERNKLLKEERPNLTYLDLLTDQLAELTCEIDKVRDEFFRKINMYIQIIESRITEGQRHFEFKYRPIVEITDDKLYLERVKKAFKEAKESDLKYRSTTIGAHREDFIGALNGLELSKSASQGEKRLGVLMLKLALYEMEQSKEKKPILILDDVFSELDENHQKKLLNVLQGYEQVFITTTEWKNEISATVYEVANHKVIRRNIYGG